MTNYAVRQQMLCFAYLAYTGEGLTTSTAEAAATISANITSGIAQINSGANNLLEGWGIVWGPVPYTVPGALYQDNLVYIVQQGSSTQYALAVRGTNFISEVDWLLEDFEINNTMPWPMPGADSTCKPGAAVTESTSIAMNILLSMQSSSGQSIIEFLRAQTLNTSINLCVTGHSLGGALSSTLALYLLENQGSWDQSAGTRSTVSAVCFAAPSAGNALFAENSDLVFTSVIGNGKFPGWDVSLLTNLDNVACDMDAAPQFYVGPNLYDNDTSTAGPIMSIYGNNINFGSLEIPDDYEWNDFFVPYILGTLSGIMYAQNYTQLSPPAASSQAALPGTYTGTIPSSSLLEDPCSTFNLKSYLAAFEAQAAWQHSYSYPLILGVPAVLNTSIVVRGLPPAAAPVLSNFTSTGYLTVTFVLQGSGFSSLNLPQSGPTNTLESVGNVLNFTYSGVEPVANIIWATGNEIYFQITNYSSISDGTLGVTVTTVNGTSNQMQITIS